MPFTDSGIFRPLYDVSEGGKPRGFQCQLSAEKDYPLDRCNRVTRTARGMISHLWLKHGLRIQQEFHFEEAKRTEL